MISLWLNPVDSSSQQTSNTLLFLSSFTPHNLGDKTFTSTYICSKKLVTMSCEVFCNYRTSQISKSTYEVRCAPGIMPPTCTSLWIRYINVRALSCILLYLLLTGSCTHMWRMYIGSHMHITSYCTSACCIAIFLFSAITANFTYAVMLLIMVVRWNWSGYVFYGRIKFQL